jgi:hypothetical protein
VKPVGRTGVNPTTVTGIQLFPNPVKHTITIQGLQNGKQQHLTVYNSIGKRVSQSVTTSNTFQLNMASLPTGIYYLEIRNSNQKQTLSFIKSN